MISPNDETMGEGDPFRGLDQDEALLAALPPETRGLIERELALRGEPGADLPHATQVRRYVCGLVHYVAHNLGQVASAAAASALSQHFTPNPDTAAISEEEWATICLTAASCDGRN